MAKITRIKATDPPKEKPKKEKPEEEKKPRNKFIKIITAPGRYLKESWQEIRQVRWTTRKATWKMVFAIFVYTALFIALIMLLDVFFTWLFNIILGS